MNEEECQLNRGDCFHSNNKFQLFACDNNFNGLIYFLVFGIRFES